MKFTNYLLLGSSFLLLWSSCVKEEIASNYENPVDLVLSTTWIEDTINAVDEEIWYRVEIGSEVTQVYVEWSEKGLHGSSRNYTANIQVDAYQLDGSTSYFEGVDSAYGSAAQRVNLNTTWGLLIRVKVKDGLTGTYALKVFEESGNATGEKIDYSLGSGWLDQEILSNEILTYRVIGGLTDQQIVVQWAEFDSPENGYTADIKASVYMLDGITPYIILDNGKNFVGKDKSHSDSPKAILLNQGENEFLVRVSLNDSSKPGTFALQIN